MISGTNQWGPYTGASSFYEVYPVYSITPAPTGQLSVPQSPTGSVTNESAAFNFDNTITSTQETLENVLQLENAQQGTLALSPSFAASQAATSTAVWGFVKWQ